MPGRPIAFYAPMKAPDHPTPSGDRQIARLTLRALSAAGFAPTTVSALRLIEKTGNADRQQTLIAQAGAEADRLIAELSPNPPALWFTYHCYYKAPDLLGPAVVDALGIPYAISEPSISPRRQHGPWARFAEASEAAIARADRLFWTTARDLPALQQAGHGARLRHLPAFVEPGPEPEPEAHPGGTLRLLTVAMMRPGDKMESYRRLAAALITLDTMAVPRPWHLQILGDGPERPAVEAAFSPIRHRVTFLGALDDRSAVQAVYQGADLFLWPGVGEGVGMVYLEAQAAGLPAIAEAHPAPSDLITGPTVPPDNPDAFAAAIMDAAADLSVNRAAARTHVLAHHSIEAAAKTLAAGLKDLLP